MSTHRLPRRSTTPRRADRRAAQRDRRLRRRSSSSSLHRRLAVSQEIGALRAATGGTRLSLSREQQVLARFRAALGPDGATLGMLLLRQGRGRL